MPWRRRTPDPGSCERLGHRNTPIRVESSTQSRLVVDDSVIELIAHRVEGVRLRRLEGRHQTHAFPRVDRTVERARDRLHLAVVEAHRRTLVAEQRTFPG